MAGHDGEMFDALFASLAAIAPTELLLIAVVAMFASMLGEWIPRLGIDDSDGRYRSLLLTEIAR